MVIGLRLSNMRQEILEDLDEPEIDNTKYRSSGTDPWARVNRALNQAELNIGNRMIAEGMENWLKLRVGPFTMPGESSNILLETLEPSGLLVGSRVVKVVDTTDDPQSDYEYPLSDPDDMPRFTPTFRNRTRWGELREGAARQRTYLTGRDITISPELGSARLLSFDIIPPLGTMSIGWLRWVQMTASGSGYTAAPTLKIGSTTMANAAAVMRSNGVAGVVLGDDDNGFSFAAGEVNPTITFEVGQGQPGTGAAGFGLLSEFSVLPDWCGGSLVMLAAIILLAKKQMDVSQIDGFFEERIWRDARNAHGAVTGPATRYEKTRSRYRGN